ncbi:MAG: hypothetical protein ACYTAF_15430 [Planctomycetota bacterium]|jgi:hypothetical protein
MSQILYIGDSTAPLEVVKTYKKETASAMVFETPEGRFVTADKKPITDLSLCEGMPADMYERAKMFLEGKSREKEAHKAAELVAEKRRKANAKKLEKMSRDALLIMAHEPDGSEKTDEELRAIIVRNM